MHNRDADDDRMYVVLVNHEEQYSLWLAGKDIPLGWKQVDGPAPKAECLAYVKEVWTDMRPLSLRDRGYTPAAPPPVTGSAGDQVNGARA